MPQRLTVFISRHGGECICEIEIETLSLSFPFLSISFLSVCLSALKHGEARIVSRSGVGESRMVKPTREGRIHPCMIRRLKIPISLKLRSTIEDLFCRCRMVGQLQGINRSDPSRLEHHVIMANRSIARLSSDPCGTPTLFLAT